jgi:hypothetical protein
MVRPSSESDDTYFQKAERRLALEIRSQFFAFAVIQGDALIDWGTRGFPVPAHARRTAVKRVASLLRLYAPAIVISRPTRDTSHGSSRIAAGILNAIRKEVENRSRPFTILGRDGVRQFFARHGIRNKWGRAALAAMRFNVLESKLPRPRKKWESERQILAVFDAVATAIAAEDPRLRDCSV